MLRSCLRAYSHRTPIPRLFRSHRTSDNANVLVGLRKSYLVDAIPVVRPSAVPPEGPASPVSTTSKHLHPVARPLLTKTTAMPSLPFPCNSLDFRRMPAEAPTVLFLLGHDPQLG